MLEKRVAAIGKLCFGLAGLFAGDPNGAVSVAEVAAGVIDRARAAGKEPEAVFARAMAEHRRVWAVAYSGDSGALESVEALLEDSLAVVFDPGTLTVAAFQPDGLYVAAAAAVTRQLGLDDPRQHSDVAQRYAVGLIAAGLEAALLAGGLAQRFRDRLAVEQARQIGVMQGKLDRLGVEPDLPRELLESLALRFEHANPDAPAPELLAFLKAKAAEWKELKARLAALEAEDPRIGNARAAAEAAIAVGNFDAADAVLAGAEELQQEHRTLVEVRRQAGLRQARAEALLLKGDADGAAAHFETAAGFLLPFAPLEAASVRQDGAGRLYLLGIRFGGTGLLQAVELYRRNEAIWTRAAHPVDWAKTQNNLGVALWPQAGTAALLAEAVAAFRAALEVRTRAEHPLDWAMTQNNLGAALAHHGRRTPGAAGAVLLAEAVAAFRAALEVRTRAEHPLDWAMTQNNLAIALAEQAGRTKGAAEAALLAEAVAAFRAALEVRTRAVDRVAWAQTQNNLADALAGQGGRTEGAAGAVLLADAVAAYRAALEVRSQAEHPLSWAMTQNNLGATLADQAKRTEGAAGAALLAEAAAAYRAALEVYTRPQHPVDWAMLQHNLGETFADQGVPAEGAEGAVMLAAAVVAYRGALEVRTRAAHPVDWAMTQENLGLAFEEMADRGDEAAGRYAEALACFDAALAVFGAGGMEPNRAKCAGGRARVAGKLAAGPSAES